MIVYGFEFNYIELIALGLMFLMFLYQLYFYSRYIFGVLRLRKHTMKNKVTFVDAQVPVSVIICAKDEVDNLRKYLPFVLAQEYPDFEVIVVNDGSTDDGTKKVQYILDRLIDGSKERLKKEKEKINIETPVLKSQNFDYRLVINDFLISQTPCKISLINQTNQGVSIARNNGGQLAKFDYIAFLDADDWWDEHFLEEMKGLIEEFPEAALYGCNYFYVKNGKNMIEDKGLPSDFTLGYIDYISVYSTSFVVPINCSFVVVRKDIFISAGGFRENLKFGEDFDLWLRIALNNKVAYLNKPLAFSNQDAEITNRAIGSNTLYTPEENVIFNLDTLLELESKHAKLKTLLDGLRVRALHKYHLQGKFEHRVKSELNKVDFAKQPFFFRFIYFFPKPLVKLYFKIKITGSRIKHAL